MKEYKKFFVFMLSIVVVSSLLSLMPPLCLQINTLRTTPDDFADLLRQKGIVQLSVREDFPSVTIPSRRVDMLPGYEEGLFFVQDRGIGPGPVRILGEGRAAQAQQQAERGGKAKHTFHRLLSSSAV